MEFENFGVMPGMTTWVDTTPSYKKAYYEYQEKIKKSKEIKELLEEEMRVKREVKRIPPRPNARVVGKPQHFHQSKPVKLTNEITLDAVQSNEIDEEFFENLNKNITHIEKAKSILLVCDVKGWAWWNKSQYLKHHLSDEFNIGIDYVLGSGSSKLLKRSYDLYFTYGYSYIDQFRDIKGSKKMTGVTAHRPLDMIQRYMKTDHIHANSIMLMQELRKFHRNVHYIPNGVDENLFMETKPINRNTELIVGHVGKKCAQKGQDNIIIPAIKKSETKSITHLNDFRNRRPYCKMYELYNNMDVFVVASDEDGTPNPALEAAACGRPIISNKIGNMPEFIIDGYNGFLIEKDVDAYVEKLKWCKENKDKVIEMGQNARRTIEKEWTWRAQAERYREMFRKVLE